ncbi:MAG: histidine phosphatase family protein [Microthrixaceae bacterium]
MELILLRHGETEWSRSGQHTGRIDIPLTDAGREEAAAVAATVHRLLDGRLPLAVYSSPLTRALETATIVLPDAQIEQRDELMEMDYGDYEGLTRSQIQQQRPGWDIWSDGCPKGESVEQVGDRVDRFLASAGSLAAQASAARASDSGDGDGQRPSVVFAHGHLIKILAARAVGLEAADGRVFKLDTATVSMISTDRGEQVVKLWNVPAEFGPDPTSAT